MRTKRTSAIKVKSGIRGGGLSFNHNRRGLKVQAGLKAGGLSFNHNRWLLRTLVPRPGGCARGGRWRP